MKLHTLSNAFSVASKLPYDPFNLLKMKNCEAFKVVKSQLYTSVKENSNYYYHLKCIVKYMIKLKSITIMSILK